MEYPKDIILGDSDSMFEMARYYEHIKDYAQVKNTIF